MFLHRLRSVATLMCTTLMVTLAQYMCDMVFFKSVRGIQNSTFAKYACEISVYSGMDYTFLLSVGHCYVSYYYSCQTETVKTTIRIRATKILWQLE
jgi:hypothetical protein